MNGWKEKEKATVLVLLFTGEALHVLYREVGPVLGPRRDTKNFMERRFGINSRKHMNTRNNQHEMRGGDTEVEHISGQSDEQFLKRELSGDL